MRKERPSLKVVTIGALSLLWVARRLLSPTKKIKAEPHESDASQPAADAQPVQSPALDGVVIRPLENTQEAQDGTTGTREQTKPTKRRWTYQRWQTVFAGVIAFVTVVYAATAILQWRTMEKSLRVAERAYVAIEDVRSDFEARRITITLVNVGHVPANEVKLDVNVHRLQPGKEREVGSFEFYPWGATQIFPGNLKAVAEVPLENFTAEDIELIHQREEVIILAYHITYDAGFGTPESSDFTMLYDPPPTDRWEGFHVAPYGEIRRKLEEALKNQNVNKNQAK